MVDKEAVFMLICDAPLLMKARSKHILWNFLKVDYRSLLKKQKKVTLLFPQHLPMQLITKRLSSKRIFGILHP